MQIIVFRLEKKETKFSVECVKLVNLSRIQRAITQINNQFNMACQLVTQHIFSDTFKTTLDMKHNYCNHFFVKMKLTPKYFRTKREKKT